MQVDVDHVGDGFEFVARGHARSVEVLERLGRLVRVHEVETARLGHVVVLVVRDYEVVVDFVHFGDLTLAAQGEHQFFQQASVLFLFVGLGQEIHG